nr:SUMF1/EgtB/PvdO family nonheme iron enzyme [Ktedonobacterales bacterium]
GARASGGRTARSATCWSPVVPVPAGEFLMGSDPKRDKEAQGDEQPRHPVTLPTYQVARFPVTVAEYACFLRAGRNAPTDWQAQLGKLDYPVVSVSWRDAVAYAAWLAERTSQPWRLPTEAEWEKAARWDPATRVARLYPWGDQFDTGRCNTREGGKGGTTPVGTYADRGDASPCGAHDQAGNVWEWTSSLAKPYHYSVSDGRESQNATGNRVLRGGSWYNRARNARAAYRYGGLAPVNVIGVVLGFRLVLAAPSS